MTLRQAVLSTLEIANATAVLNSMHKYYAPYGYVRCALFVPLYDFFFYSYVIEWMGTDEKDRTHDRRGLGHDVATALDYAPENIKELIEGVQLDDDTDD